LRAAAVEAVDAVDAETTILIRHGQTDWSRDGMHTGWEDIPLNDVGRAQAAALQPVLETLAPVSVISSPLRRARETCELAGCGEQAVIVDDCREWNYGAYGGLTSAQIHAGTPAWSLWDDGCPEGEDAGAVGARADRVLSMRSQMDGPVAIFAHGHFLQILAARWLGFEASCGRYLVLDNAAVSLIGINRGGPAIRMWNNTGHVGS
jgi:broad specificity phosphatase PhoE